MMTNKHLLEEVHKDFERIFAMSYKDALFEFRQIHNRLMNSKTKKYDGHGKI